ncbi:tyrosine-type recombinase/integrase [Sphingobacterium sp. UBA6645]|uniref:tyrosine-type recombinase/integrase n=1 Tax=Sphingobacterium sp. UBA6645 TaxID=1947511 RepID=UPI0025E58C48|nr:site-specific integrase [Sphingobacterium sp. UBA6645]
MATIDYVIFEHHLKKKGTYNVKYRLTHKGKQVYKASEFEVSPNQIRKNFTIKDKDLLEEVRDKLSEYRKTLNRLGDNIDYYDAKSLLNLITTAKSVTDIDFFEFGDSHLKSIKAQGRNSTHHSYESVLRSFKIFTDNKPLSIHHITSSTLKEYEKFLRKGWDYTRKGKVLSTKGLAPSGVKFYFSVIQSIFNACREAYNTEFNTVINNNPFNFYKVPKAPKPRKRGNDISIEEFIELRDAELKGQKETGRDLFMLSFYLCGMNLKDIYDHNWKIVKGRIEYERSKTREKRMDRAFISVKIPDVAKPLLEKYSKENIDKRFKNLRSMQSTVYDGLPVGITFYHARHTFATWAFNNCGFSTDEIAMALNHVDNSRVTERYIATDWSIIDKVQDGVLSLISAK